MFQSSSVIWGQKGCKSFRNFSRASLLVLSGKAENNSLKFDLKYLLSILNSKLISYFLSIKSRSKIDSYPDDWKKVPIKILTFDKQKQLIFLAEKILSLNIRLDSIGDKKTSESKKIEDEISNTDNKIDQEIYKLYKITDKEKEIIENTIRQN